MHTRDDFMALAADFRACRPVLVALGDENRLHILYQMMVSAKPRGMRVGEIGQMSSLSRPALSHHLKILKDAGIVNVRKEGTKNFYYLDPDMQSFRDIIDVLDVGCGTGSVLSVIRRQSDIVGYGLDASPQMIEAARKKNPDCRLQAGDSAHLPYADASMDVVMACMAYHHFPEQAAFRQEARRVLKPGGRLYICDPRFPGIVRALLNTCFKDAGFYSVRRNASEFERSGFKVQRIIRDLYVQVLCMEKSPSQPDCLIKAE